MIKKFLTIALILATAFSSVPTYAATFTDVGTSHWAYSSIENMAAKGVVNGVGQGKFAPADKVAASEFIAMLTRCYYTDDIDQTNTADGWWFPYFEAARENSLFSGVFGVYSSTINQPLSRSNMAQMIYNLLSDKGYDMPDVNSLNNISIPDVDEDNRNWQAIYSVYKMGYLKGLDNTGRFGGSETMDRAQACAVMERLLNGVGGSTSTTANTNATTANNKFTVWAYDSNNPASRNETITFNIVETKAETYPDGIHIGTIAISENGSDDFDYGYFISPSKYKFYSANEAVVTVDKFGEVYIQSCPEPMQTITTYISVVSSEGTAKLDVKINNTFNEVEYGRKNIINEEYLTIYREEMLRLVNEIREEKGVAPLRYNSELELISNERASDIIMNFSHRLPAGSLSEELDNTYDLIDGENITRNTFGNGAADTANIHFDSWMKSEGHRKNILDPDFKSFCCSVASNQNAYAVQIFSFK